MVPEWIEHGECMICGKVRDLHENRYGAHACRECGDQSLPMPPPTRRVGILEYAFWWLAWKTSSPSEGVVHPQWMWYE